jgi:hypothetical protein
MAADLLACRRGSLFVEFLVYMPLLLLIWWLIMFVHDVGRAGLQTSRAVRECAWLYAADGCREVPPQCRGVELGGTRETDDAELHGRSSSFRELAADLPFLRDELERLHGEEIDVSRSTAVARPPVTGGSRIVRRRFRVMCDTERRTQELADVFDRTCRKLLGRWCP